MEGKRAIDEAARNKNRRVYSTDIIEQLIIDKGNGYDIDYTPFFERDLYLRAPGIPFRMTQEELDEYTRCYNDPEYFIENYCKFMTDKGLRTITLRDYQRKMIHIATDDHYDKDLDDIVPDNRNIIWLASRQCAKCGSPCERVTCSDDGGLTSKIVSIFEIENRCVRKKSLIRTIKNLLYLSYSFISVNVKSRIKTIIKDIIGICIQFIESIEYRGYDFDENDISKKIIESYDVEGVSLLSDDGFVGANSIHVTQPYRVYTLITSNGLELNCADNHVVFNDSHDEIRVKDLKQGDRIFTEYGVSDVLSVRRTPYKITMRDFTVDSKNHRYYMGGVLSHNTTTISAFLSWMIVFHCDRNILIVANKEKTAIEIVDKITNIFKGLPYFLKPGCDSFGKTGIKLDNGSKIISSATTNTASIGFTIHCVLLDEFAHIPDNIVNNFWRSVYPTLSSSAVSQCIITSTPNGTTNKFYDIWTGSIEGKNSFKNLRTDYWEVPGHDEEWAKQMIANFGEDEFAQEFALQFNKNSKMILSGKDLKYLERIKRKFIKKDIYVQNQYLDSEFLTWDPNFDPNDIRQDEFFVFLVDLAEGNGDPDEILRNKKKTPDSNTIQIMKVRLNSISNMRKYSNISCRLSDAFKFQQVGKYECNSEDEIQCARVCSALAYNLFKDNEFNNVRIMVEMNFNGKSFFEEFKRHPLYSGSTILKTYHTRPVPGEKRKKKYGFKTTSNKEYYCTKGNKMISKRRIVTFDEDTYNQMNCFGYVKGVLKGIACHDDLSMPIFNHIPRMLDEQSFIGWLEEKLLYYSDKVAVFKINNLIEMWALENPEMSDSDFSMMYGLGVANEQQYQPYTGAEQQYGQYGGYGAYQSYEQHGGFGMRVDNPYMENYGNIINYLK